jgi:peptidoglycan/xylan/chitin deacetylase (PgdA/CDA1 family)
VLTPISRLLHSRAHIRGPVALMYHSVSPGPVRPDWPWAVSLDSFKAHLDFLLAEGWKTTTLSNLTTRPTEALTKTVAITFDDGYADNFAAFEALMQRDMKASWFIVSGSIGRSAGWQDPGMPELTLLAATQLREMHQQGMEIGSHTVNHAKLPQQNDATLHRELRTSKLGLEDILGAPVMGLAYPYGLFDDRCRHAAQDTGYLHACTTQSGWALLDKDPYLVRRLTVYNTDTVSTLARKMAYAANDIAWGTLIKARLNYTLSRMTKP